MMIFLFLRRDDVWGTQAGFTFAQTALGPCVYKVVSAQKREDSYLASDTGIDDGGKLLVLCALMWVSPSSSRMTAPGNMSAGYWIH